MKQHIVQRALVGCAGLATFHRIRPRSDVFPGRVGQQDEGKISEELDPEVVLADEMVDPILDFFDRQKPQLAICRRMVEMVG